MTIALPKDVPVPIMTALAAASSATAVPLRVLLGVAWVESRFHPNSTGPVLRNGDQALGLMQILRSNAADWRIDAFNIDQAAHAAARFLKAQFDHFGSWEQALAAYNWGPARVQSRPQPEQWPAQVVNYVRNVQGAGLAAPIPFLGRSWTMELVSQR